MQNFRETTEESRRRWDINADCWDARMGDNSNFFHRTIVRPHTEQLLDVREGDLVLDVACGNGNFSRRLAEKGAHVVAFDYSENLIAHAKRRRAAYQDRISFHVCDATDGCAIAVPETGHPCFVKPQDTYLTPCVHEGEAIRGQPVLQYYYHRSLQDIFQICFQAGFAIDGFYEEPDDDKEYPVIVIVRLRKQPEDLRSPS